MKDKEPGWLSVNVYRRNGRRDESHFCDGTYDTHDAAGNAAVIALRDPIVGRVDIIKTGKGSAK
jgi:hypothetical protein